jgi:hypothetical protein
MKSAVVAFLSAVSVMAGCSTPAVSKAVGTGGDADTPIAIGASVNGVTVENRTGRPLLDVRIMIDGGSPGSSFIRTVPTIDTGATSESQPSDFRTDDGTLLDLALVHPTRVAVTARDTVARTYSVAAPWAPRPADYQNVAVRS